MKKDSIIKQYETARETMSEQGVDTDLALDTLHSIRVSLPCWQADDIHGSESEQDLHGMKVTGDYPGRARNNLEIRQDLLKALSLIPGRHRISLHAMYGDLNGKKVDRDRIEPVHFKQWLEWAGEAGLLLDFNATCFSHPKASSNFTLSSLDAGIRDFWVEHVHRCREISAFIGAAQAGPCLQDIWIPDGFKDIPYSCLEHRSVLTDSLDRIFSLELPSSSMLDFLESKLFGIGSEAYVVGSYDFYLSYAVSRKRRLCLDMGHFHPTESVADKISSLLLFTDSLLLHISRGVRWDSDHVPIVNQELQETAQRIVRDGFLKRVHLAMDFFDASVNRIGAYVIASRSVQKALLSALLEPGSEARKKEAGGDYMGRLAWMEAAKTAPVGAVWDYYCEREGVPRDPFWMREVQAYESAVLSRRQ